MLNSGENWELGIGQISELPQPAFVWSLFRAEGRPLGGKNLVLRRAEIAANPVLIDVVHDDLIPQFVSANQELDRLVCSTILLFQLAIVNLNDDVVSRLLRIGLPELELDIRYSFHLTFLGLLDIELEEIPLTLLSKIGQLAGIACDLLAQRGSHIGDLSPAGGKVCAGRVEIGSHGLYLTRNAADFCVGILLNFRQLGGGFLANGSYIRGVGFGGDLAGQLFPRLLLFGLQALSKSSRCIEFLRCDSSAFGDNLDVGCHIGGLSPDLFQFIDLIDKILLKDGNPCL